MTQIAFVQAAVEGLIRLPIFMPLYMLLNNDPVDVFFAQIAVYSLTIEVSGFGTGTAF